MDMECIACPSDRPYECAQCPKVFTRSDHLTRHKASKHSGAGRPYKCAQCPKAFTRSDHLFRHGLGEHAQARRFACDTCTKAFARSDHLRVHAEFVHDEGEHECATCMAQRHSSIQMDGIRVCKACYRKATGRGSRVELLWADYLERHFDMPAMGQDDSLKAMGGCSKRRPDLIYGSPGLVVCCELDEHAHRGYDRSCEEARMSELAEELGVKVVFLRMNPHGKGPPLEVRFKRYMEALEEICTGPPDHHVSVQYLYYPPGARNMATRWPARRVDS